MPKFTVEHKSHKKQKDAYEVIKKFLNEDNNDFQRIDPKVQCHFNDGQMICELKGGQFKADVTVLSQADGSSVKITVDIPFLLLPFKGKITESLQRKLAKYLG